MKNAMFTILLLNAALCGYVADQVPDNFLIVMFTVVSILSIVTAGMIVFVKED